MVNKKIAELNKDYSRTLARSLESQRIWYEEQQANLETTFQGDLNKAKTDFSNLESCFS